MAKISTKRMLPDLVDSLSEQLAMVCGDAQQVRKDCREFKKLLTHPPSISQLKHLRKLAHLLIETDDFIALPLYELLAEIVEVQQKPWPMLKLLLHAGEEAIVQEAVRLALGLVNKQKLYLNKQLLLEFARLMSLEFSPFEDEELLEDLKKTFDSHYPSGNSDENRLLSMMRKDSHEPIRKLAARLLDHDGGPASEENSRQVLGNKAYGIFAPYLNFTRANHCDLMDLCGGKRLPAKTVEMFRIAGKENGEGLVREILTEVGWANVSLGLKVETLVEIVPQGTLPLLVKRNEVALFSNSGISIGRDFQLVTTHGGSALTPGRRSKKSDPVDRFRRLNITHAELLGEILDVAPLDKAKADRINSHLDEVVETYATLFSDLSDDCSILEDLWRELRGRVSESLINEPDTGPLSAEVTRLVLAFEDPANLGEVRSVHGLKRYLHQKGLKLGFKMVDTSHAPNRTVNLILVVSDDSRISSSTIRYAEFEAGIECSRDQLLPYPVRVVTDGMSRQMLHGTKSFPSVDIFIFANEVHYYLAFRNHPAFLRVDFSPPQRGGMMDLEYYGVSNYEIDLHPNPGLESIRLLFRKLDFDVRMEGMRLFVRYDKEASNSLRDLCDHVEMLFRLAPYLMEVDWVIGSLKLSDGAKKKVAEHWADRFRRCGVLPLNTILNKKRTGVLVGCTDGPTGVEEIIWDGKGSCDDRFSQSPPPDFIKHLLAATTQLSFPLPTIPDDLRQGMLPLLMVEKSILKPVREALKVGRLVCRAGELCSPPDDCFHLIHEAEYFASLLAEEGPEVAESCRLARPLAELEKFMEFSPSGFVGGLVVERGRVAMLGGDLNIFVVRDAHGVIRLGAYCAGNSISRWRKNYSAKWKTNARLDANNLWELMLSANYLAGVLSLKVCDPDKDLADLKAGALLSRPVEDRQFSVDDRIMKGLKAAPGRAVGRVLFGTDGRQPNDLNDAILVARKVCPTDNQFLSHAAGILSTGGAVLSHAALLAIQFGKPAMVAEADWSVSSGTPVLRFTVPEFREVEHHVQDFCVREQEVVRHHTEELMENDLVILDANEGFVQIIGQDRDTLALWDGLRLLGEACQRADCPLGDVEVLEVRAQQLRARHQIQKIVDRLSDPVLTAFAVEEIVVGETMAKVVHSDKKRLLFRIMANARVEETALAKLREISRHLADCCASAERAAMEQIPTSKFLYEVLGLRLRAMHWRVTLTDTVNLLKQFGVDEVLPPCTDQMAVHVKAQGRLSDLRDELLVQLETELAADGILVRHLQRRIGRIGAVLGESVSRPDLIMKSQEYLAQLDSRSLVAGQNQLILKAEQCGLETHPLVGWKAANLAEIDRLVGAETVPPWFAVTNNAFNRMLEQPVGSAEYLTAGALTLADAIQFVLGRVDLDNKAKSEAIQKLWIEALMPDDLQQAVTQAHAELVTDAEFVALRSSSCDEDTETVMRAGEFDSFLFVKGMDSFLKHLRLTWSGLWTERALYSREGSGTFMKWPAGGVIIQRMICSRVSGVLQTVNVARGDLRELLINVSLGLGEGIVSGLVAADLVTVVKDFAAGEDPTHLNYLTNDKPEQMVFDHRCGFGTRLEETLYHQRLRPALEYFELCELVAGACALEDGYGYPLDIEFAIEDDRLWLLQARPIATFRAELQKTMDHYPLCVEPGVLR